MTWFLLVFSYWCSKLMLWFIGIAKFRRQLRWTARLYCRVWSIQRPHQNFSIFFCSANLPSRKYRSLFYHFTYCYSLSYMNLPSLRLSRLYSYHMWNLQTWRKLSISFQTFLVILILSPSCSLHHVQPPNKNLSKPSKSMANSLIRYVEFIVFIVFP